MTFITTRRVEFRDTDAAGIVHFSAFFPMMEAAEHEMLRSLGIPILPQQLAGKSCLTWPRVAAHCNYISAARFEDLLRIETHVARLGNTSVEYHFRILRDALGENAGQVPPALVAEGTLTAVACELTEGGTLEKVSVPTWVRELLNRHTA
jgi:acyl-CoA thioester hydrolase